MNKKFLTLLLVVCPAIAYAQADAWLNKINNKIKTKATARADKKIDQAIDKGLDIAEGKNMPAEKTGPAQKKQEDITAAGAKTYVKYDFVPGEHIIYSNNFATDNMGELPTGWNSNGSGAVVTLDALRGNGVQLYQNTIYLTDNKVPFTENFTLEFDLVLRLTNPKAAFPEFVWGIFSSGSLETTDNELLKNYAGTFATEMHIQPSGNHQSQINLQTFHNSKNYFRTDISRPGELLQRYNQVIHVSMQVQKERLRIWFDEEKLYDLPKAVTPGMNINQLYFIVKRYGGPDQEVGYIISNIKIAKGLPDTRHKLVDEGKFSTTGILFDVNSYTILPESNGVLSEIAGVLVKNPDLKIRIVGHTDSDGDDAANLELSKKRAAEVKQTLVSNFNIDAARIGSDGAGESQPAGNNNTKEGKANNRRVEFIKR
ncbi:OmpA family protein [Chitinophaga sp. GCM10012297]|uniref:OmpA family protein n=1 Tax=Chitinophaga chungangae TaxID=2821488 RepID=A0ABS3YMR2_9BACT|nr:OmpA family protein [Chitinophaga chungangae]MBO9155364.1 OmpA family protein [Chitinophaga chungangae]